MDDWTPGDLIRQSFGYWSACTIHACVKLDLFTHLGKRVMSLDQLAESVGADERGLALLLDAASALNLLKKSGETYRTTLFSQRYLSKSSPEYLGYIILHQHYLVEAWSKLDSAVVSGHPVRQGASDNDPAQREAFLMGMDNLASLIAPVLVPQIDLGGARHLLDLGGGPGTWALHFCRHHPELAATVFDLPASQPFEKRCAEAQHLDDRVDFQAGDFLKDPIRGRYDAAWLSHVLHGEPYENCVLLLKKVARVLPPGAVVLIHEFILDDSGDSPLFPALFSLNMLLHCQGRSYRQGELAQMLETAGFEQIERLTLENPGESAVMRARRCDSDASVSSP